MKHSKTGIWSSPAGQIMSICVDMLKQPHMLIAGATGSGKSVLLNSLIYTALYQSSNDAQFILIDPKRVELIDYAELPHTISYNTEIQPIINSLNYAIDLMELRYTEMQQQRIKKSTKADVYVIIDEYADLMVQAKSKVTPLIQRLTQLGRAANIHVILATQRPTRDIIDGAIKVNIDSRVALRCPTPQDSRNVIDRKGAELLPKYGKGIYLNSDRCEIVEIPYTPQEEINRIITHWMEQVAEPEQPKPQKKMTIFDIFNRRSS